MRSGKLLILVFAVLLISSVSASFEVGNLSHSIETKYGPGANIQGWINISAEDQTSNSLINDLLGKSIKLKNLLDLNSAEYDCLPLDCGEGYFAIGTGKTDIGFSLEEGTNKIIGLKLTGIISSINSISFEVESNAVASCTNQLEIGFFADDEIVDFKNNKSTSDLCSRNYGCFDESKSFTEFEIDNTPYCQKIKLSESPGFRIGAWIKKVSGSRNFTMEIHDENGFRANCKILGEDISTNGEEISCYVNYAASGKEDYYVCIYSNQGSGEYKIKGYSDYSNGCGFHDMPIPNETPGVFKIFAQGKKFGDFGTLQITNDFGYGENLANLVQEYIEKKYGGLDCLNGCIAPIKFTSTGTHKGDLQIISLSKLSLKYTTIAPTTENNFYELTKSPAKVSFDFQKLWLDSSGFIAPTDYGKYNYTLKLGSKSITEKIDVDEVPIIQRLFPIMTVSAYPTKFEVKLDSYDNVSKYEWDFGNGNSLTTENNTATYTYNTTGFYDLKITITTDEEFSTYKIFNLTVGSPEEVINITLKKHKKNLENLKEDFKDYSFFTLQSLEEIFNLEEKESAIEQLESDFEIAETEQEFNVVLSELLEIDLPKSVSTTSESDSLTYYPQKENVDVYLIEKITGEETSESNENVVNAIFVWNQKNLVTKIGFTEISAIYSDSEESVLTVFTLNFDEKNNFDDKAYLIFDNLENLNFDKDYSQKEEADFVYIDLEDAGKTIAFSTTEDVSFSDLPVFISPGFSQLALRILATCGDDVCEGSENSETCPEDCEEDEDYTLYILIVVFLLLLSIVVYVFMQIWYKKKYEGHLFKNKNDLFNIMHYVNSSKKKGLSKSEIEKNLRKSKWRNEQVNYAMKKYSGKRTGMAELPIDKLIKKISSKKS